MRACRVSAVCLAATQAPPCGHHAAPHSTTRYAPNCNTPRHTWLTIWPAAAGHVTITSQLRQHMWPSLEQERPNRRVCRGVNKRTQPTFSVILHPLALVSITRGIHLHSTAMPVTVHPVAFVPPAVTVNFLPFPFRAASNLVSGVHRPFLSLQPSACLCAAFGGGDDDGTGETGTMSSSPSCMLPSSPPPWLSTDVGLAIIHAPTKRVLVPVSQPAPVVRVTRVSVQRSGYMDHG